MIDYVWMSYFDLARVSDKNWITGCQLVSCYVLLTMPDLVIKCNWVICITQWLNVNDWVYASDCEWMIGYVCLMLFE